MTVFTDFLASYKSQKRLLVQLSPYDVGGAAVTQLYYSSHGFTSEPSDTPANTYYASRLKAGFEFKRSLFSQGKLSGRSIPGAGSIVLDNNDGALDVLNTYAWGGRRVRVWLGGEDFALADYGLIFDGVAQGISFNGTECTVHLQDLQSTLDIELQTRLFAGSGGVEGGTDVLNKRKPVAYGVRRNFSLVYLGADTGYEKFAVGDGRAIVGVLKVRDRGVELDYTSSSTPAAGQWTVDVSNGVITLAVFDGPVTCDVIGRRYLSVTSTTSWTIAVASKTFSVASTSGYVVGQKVRVGRTSALGSTWGDGPITAIVANTSITINVTTISGAVGPFTDWTISPWGTIAGIAKAIATDLGVTSFDAASFTALDTAQPATAGLWVPEGGNGLQLLDQFIDGASCFYGFDRSASFEVGRVIAPASPVAAYTGQEILQDTFERRDTAEPNWQVIVRCQKNHTVMSGDQIAAIVSDADWTFLTSEWRQGTDDDTAVLTAYPQSQPIQIDGVYDAGADADTEATRLLALFGVRRDYFSFDLKTQPLSRDVNDVISVTRVDNRFSLSGGKNLVIVDIDEDLSKNAVTVGAWG